MGDLSWLVAFLPVEGSPSTGEHFIWVALYLCWPSGLQWLAADASGTDNRSDGKAEYRGWIQTGSMQHSCV